MTPNLRAILQVGDLLPISVKLAMVIVIFSSIFEKSAISLFVYYNLMVHSSKTTKDTTSAQENFFVYAFFPIKWRLKRASSTWLIFLQLFASGHVQAKCGAGLNYMGWNRFFHSDIITISIKTY